MRRKISSSRCKWLSQKHVGTFSLAVNQEAVLAKEVKKQTKRLCINKAYNSHEKRFKAYSSRHFSIRILRQ